MLCLTAAFPAEPLDEDPDLPGVAGWGPEANRRDQLVAAAAVVAFEAMVDTEPAKVMEGELA